MATGPEPAASSPTITPIVTTAPAVVAATATATPAPVIEVTPTALVIPAATATPEPAPTVEATALPATVPTSTPAAIAPAPSSAAAATPAPPVAGSQAVLAANGGEVYTLNCARCHAENGLGTPQYSATLIGVGGKYSSQGMIAELTNGHPVTFGFAGRLSEEEIASVVAYVKATFP